MSLKDNSLYSVVEYLVINDYLPSRDTYRICKAAGKFTYETLERMILELPLPSQPLPEDIRACFLKRHDIYYTVCLIMEQFSNPLQKQGVPPHYIRERLMCLEALEECINLILKGNFYKTISILSNIKLCCISKVDNGIELLTVKIQNYIHEYLAEVDVLSDLFSTMKLLQDVLLNVIKADFWSIQITSPLASKDVEMEISVPGSI